MVEGHETGDQILEVITTNLKNGVHKSLSGHGVDPPQAKKVPQPPHICGDIKDQK